MIVGRGEKIFRVVNNCFMVLLMLITLYPLLYVLFASLSDPVEFGKVTGLLWKPAGFSTRGYEAVLNSANIWLGFRNTIFYVVVGTACSMGITILGAYPLSRKGFLLKKPIMLFIIFTMFFSGGLVPWYLMCSKFFKFNNHIYSLILPCLFSVWNMIIAKSFMKGIPFELTEAAKVDGAGDFYIFWKIILPTAKPLIATIGLFTALTYWNDWYNCMLFMSTGGTWNLQYTLQNILNSSEALKRIAAMTGMQVGQVPTEGLKLAMTVIATGPIILLYPFLQKYFVKGISIGAVKG